ncbi:MAG: alpha/beta fold hydrolase [Gammaproteobacteria bacterium]|nr:alpha/beta fold hydrolase [Gammaproteobacteria bacterium]
MAEQRLKFDEYDVTARIDKVTDSIATLVFAHGAGASMHHGTLEEITHKCNESSISVLRFNFPYMEAGKNRTDSQAVATLTIKAALELAQKNVSGPYFLGGHSFGGRMASHAVVDHDLDVAGLVFCSFPLHTPKKPGIARAEHMDAIKVPMLFLSGTRDGMAQRELMNGVVTRLNAELHWLDTADHGYKVLKRTRQRTDDVFSEMGGYISAFVSASI